MSCLGYLSSNKNQTIIDWLVANSNHPMTYYLMTAILPTRTASTLEALSLSL